MTGELWTHRLLATDPTSPRKRISKVCCPLDRTRTTGPGGEPLSSATDSERHAFRENTHFVRSSGPRGRCRIAENVNQLILSTFSRTVVNSAHLLHRFANRPSIDDGASHFASNVLINQLCTSLTLWR